ncbi:MAG: ABC transporter ATP-binding protein [Synergistaceae bacterium]|jgi:ABC-type Fe3+/spermidine/putrescine transport system ATPase subunit|nr:ABC transporter ATP-binding protein [Synergistaceae bacterium]
MDLLNSPIKLQVRNLMMRYGANEVLCGVSFDVRSGEFLSILGPSGCGKTTILRILIGLLKPESGSVFKDGVDITNAHPSKRGMGIVFQNYALFQNMTILGNVEYALRVKRETRRQSREIAVSIIERVGLKEHMHKRPHHLSGGQQQRVAVARTLAMGPDVVLLDEPMSALDAAARLSMREELIGIQDTFGTTMIYITHDQEEAFALSDRIIVMEAGKVSQFDMPENIISNPANEYVRDFVVRNLELKLKSLAKYLR